MLSSSQLAARVAARQIIGSHAIEGADFTVHAVEGGWEWRRVPAANKAAKAAQQAREASSALQAQIKADTKTIMLMAMLNGPKGATAAEIETATGWVRNTVRSWIGTQRKAGVPIMSDKVKGRPTIYRILEEAV